MKTTKILYWIFTILFSVLMFGSAISAVLSMPDTIKGMHDGLGYPIYFIPFLGVAKMLGVIAILTPGHARLKEWAYAGLFFDLVAAAYSLYCVPQPQPGGAWYFMVLPLGLAIAAYVFYRKKDSLKAMPTGQSSMPVAMAN